MILHLATFRWRDGVTGEEIDALTVALRSMAEQLPMLRSYVCGPALGIRPGADYAVAAVVDDAEALNAYIDSPEHALVYKNNLGDMVAERSAAQLPLTDGAFS
ncbi:MAG TPA: Dabb family protein [Terrimesophilobacter sp.]|nr:Dabb family protein [Terrimesophilobacter sp.]HRQ01075.1 Dabb family protein [Terrimesophilobacter sp.]